MATICFDLDGTLTDPKPGITRSIRHALIALTGEAPEEDALTWCIGPPLLASFETLLAGKGDAAAALAKYRERFGDVGLFENEVYPAIPETLAALVASGHRLFVATSKPTIYARRIVEHFDLSRYFDDVFGAELDGRRSDKSELLAWLLAGRQVAPAEATMVGDRRHDMVGARANAMRAVGVLYGYGSEAELTEAGAEALCATPEALADVLAPHG
jgi:phosphoglycolate phosphatase